MRNESAGAMQHRSAARKATNRAWRGREKLHYLNPIPIHQMYERWIVRYEEQHLDALRDLKKKAAGEPRG
jgi:hypothetical protein